jgi:hypothetical protein
MLRLKNGGSIRKGGEKTSTRDYTYKKADGTEMVVPVRTSPCSKVETSNYTKKVCTLYSEHPNTGHSKSRTNKFLDKMASRCSKMVQSNHLKTGWPRFSGHGLKTGPSD